MAQWAENVGYVNPLSKKFDGKKIFLNDIADPITNRISGKIFTDCDLIGPEVVAMMGGGVNGATLALCNVVQMPVRGQRIFNAIVMEDCQIYRGRIAKFVLLAGDKTAEDLKKMDLTPISHYPGDGVTHSNADSENRSPEGQD